MSATLSCYAPGFCFGPYATIVGCWRGVPVQYICSFNLFSNILVIPISKKICKSPDLIIFYSSLFRTPNLSSR